MNCVFQASTSVEAYMIKSLLESNEIPAEVYGEHLQGGLGELQAIGAVRVMVADDYANSARELISEWERHEPPSEPGYEAAGRRQTTTFSFWSFWAGFLAACLLFKFLPI